METLTSWDVLLQIAGKAVENVSKDLKYNQPLSLEKLQELNLELKNVTAVLDKRINSLKVGN